MNGQSGAITPKTGGALTPEIDKGRQSQVNQFTLRLIDHQLPLDQWSVILMMEKKDVDSFPAQARSTTGAAAGDGADPLQRALQENASLLARLATEERLRKEAEGKLSFERLLLHTLVEHCPFRIYAKDMQSRFIFGNMEVAHFMGAESVAQLLGKTDFDFYPPALAAAYYADEQALLQSVQPLIEHEEPVIDLRNGEQAWILTTKAPLQDQDGKTIGLLGLNVNITERKCMERELVQRNGELTELNRTLSHAKMQLIQSEKLAALGYLVAGVAHELNTPLGNSVLVASVLADQTYQFASSYQTGLTRKALEDFIEKTTEASAILARNLQRAANLVSSFKQIAVDQTSVQRREFSLANTINEILATLAPVFRKSGVTVNIAIPPDLKMDSFPGPLGQILVNLINNAIVHGFEGRDGGTLTIVAESNEDWLALRVGDDGAGIPAANLPRIFDPFFTTKLGVGGSGLGLSIVHNIATGLLGGDVAVNSSPGTGTHFMLRIPLSAPSRASAAKDHPDVVDGPG